MNLIFMNPKLNLCFSMFVRFLRAVAAFRFWKPSTWQRLVYIVVLTFAHSNELLMDPFVKRSIAKILVSRLWPFLGYELKHVLFRI